MIDHVLGRPSVKFRKIQVLAVVSFWSLYLFKGNKHGPPPIRRISRSLSTMLTPWQTLVMTLLYLYIARNLGKLLGLECPEPLANLYTRSYFRATWVTTALDAGFWTAMRIQRKWLRDLCSIIFSIYYLIAAEQADEKVRKVRGVLTLDHLRVSWDKGTTPYLAFASALLRPRLMKYPPRAIRIPRPSSSDYKEPISGWLYFDGPLSALKMHTKVVLDIPGGGFVAMSPRANDDKLFAWAGKTGFPVLSLNYKKAPEFPYPYALNECYDAYRTLIASRGRCVGLSGEVIPKVILTGDSAGGNLAAAAVLMIIESGSTDSRRNQGEVALPVPDGLILIYPGLDLNISNWISDEKMSLIRDRKMRKLNKNMVREKSMQYTHLVGTPDQSDNADGDTPEKPKSPQVNCVKDTLSSTSSPPPIPVSQTAAMNENAPGQRPSASHQPAPLQTRLAMSSMITYFNDRILSPEMMRAMIILYIGPHARPNFATDYLLSPMLAPDSLLCKFPKTYFLTGERDPMVDDTVIFAGHLRRAKAALHERQAQQNGRRLLKEFDDKDVVEVALIPGISHGFLQFAGLFPEGWKHLFRCARWINDIFARSEEKQNDVMLEYPNADDGYALQHCRRTESSGDEDHGLEMSMAKSKGAHPRAVAATPPRGASVLSEEKAEIRKKKEKLLKEHLDEKREDRTRVQDGDDHGRREEPQRKKSLVSLASSDDLLSRRMLGLAGRLTGRGDG